MGKVMRFLGYEVMRFEVIRFKVRGHNGDSREAMTEGSASRCSTITRITQEVFWAIQKSKVETGKRDGGE